VAPAVKHRIDPTFGSLQWSDDGEYWIGQLPETGAVIHLNPEPATPDIFPKKWASWVKSVDRDPQWIGDECKAELKKLHGYGWPVLPFEATLSLVSFDTSSASLYLDIPALAPHIIEVHLNSRMGIRSFSVAG